jgi:hypothetical protein
MDPKTTRQRAAPGLARHAAGASPSRSSALRGGVPAFHRADDDSKDDPKPKEKPVPPSADDDNDADDDKETRGLFDWKEDPGDEPGTLADVMDGTTPQNAEEEEKHTFL